MVDLKEADIYSNKIQDQYTPRFNEITQPLNSCQNEYDTPNPYINSISPSQYESQPQNFSQIKPPEYQSQLQYPYEEKPFQNQNQPQFEYQPLTTSEN